MSHIVKIQTQVRDATAVSAACRRRNLAEPQYETVKLFTATETGLAVRLPGWNYPVVCDLAAGVIKFDNFGGRWGEKVELDRFLQCYAVEKTKLEARRSGHTVVEQALANGSVKLTIQVQGGAA